MKKLFLVLFFLALSFQFTLAQKDDDVIKFDTSLVLVPVTVIDDQGRFIPNLKREDFKLFEEGKEQVIEHFDTVDAPFTVVIMLDMSDSTRFRLEEIHAAAQAFVDQLRPADKVALFTFDQYVTKALEATADRAEIRSAILRSRSGGGTSLYAAMSDVTNYLRTVKGRTAVVLFTDGIDTTTLEPVNFFTTLKMAQETDAMIFPIQYDTVTDSGGKKRDIDPKLGTAQIMTTKGERVETAYKRGTQYLTTLALNSGGKFHFAESVGGLSESFARIAQQLKEQYTLGFYPAAQTPDGKQRDLKVQLPGAAKAKMRYRRGYILKPATK